MFHNKTKLTILLVCIFALLSLQGFKALQANTDEKYNPKTDKIVTPVKQNIQDVITLAGFVDTEDQATLRFQTSGKLAWVGVRVGDRVKKWQAIASLDKRDLTKRFQKEANDYLTNRSTFEDVQDQYQSIRDNHLVTDEIQRILDRQQYSLNNAVLDYELADLAVKYATISSPIDGIVTKIDTPNPGVNISPSTADFVIVNPSTVFFSSEIDEEYANQIKIGQASLVTVDSVSSEPLESEIYYISFLPIAGKSSTVYQLKSKLNVDNNDLKYRLGMNGDVKIVLSQATDVLTVPLDALIDKDFQTYLLVLEGKSTKLIPVTTGIETDTDIEIKQGLQGNEQIIIKG